MYAGLEDALRDPTQNVSITTKPVVPGQGGAGAGGQQQMVGPKTPGQTTSGAQDTNHPSLNRNPQLVSTPSTVQADDIYTAKLAQARYKTDAEYLSALRDIGFTNDEGQMIPGLIQTEAARRQYDFEDARRLATEGVNDASIKGGTFFSGRRGQNLSNVQDPYDVKLARNTADMGTDIEDRYSDITNLLSGYTLTMDELLSELSARQATRARTNPSGAIGGVTALHPAVNTHVSTGMIGRGRF